jgi:hypothetical protein
VLGTQIAQSTKKAPVPPHRRINHKSVWGFRRFSERGIGESGPEDESVMKTDGRLLISLGAEVCPTSCAEEEFKQALGVMHACMRLIRLDGDDTGPEGRQILAGDVSPRCPVIPRSRPPVSRRQSRRDAGGRERGDDRAPGTDVPGKDLPGLRPFIIAIESK